MVVTTIIGGMGNQLRAYASAYTVTRYLNQQLALDVSDYFGGYFRPYVLDRLNIPDHLKLFYPHKKPIYNCPYAVPGNFLKGFDCILNIDRIKDRRALLEAVEGKENIWLMGYGRLSFCTQEERRELKGLFQPLTKSKCVQNFTQRAMKEDSIAVHIRRTDFIDNGWADDETLRYYQAAISYLNRQLDRTEYYFFSDDMEWVKKALGHRENYHYINCLGGMGSDMDELFLMAACRHHILTDQSTFGAWAAFLSQTEGVNIVNGGGLDIPGSFVMDRERVDEWQQEYKAEYGTRTEIIVPWSELEGKLEENDNEAVIDYIDRLALDSYGISPEVKERLTELKGIAHIQDNDALAALSAFDCLQQSQRDCFDFSFNYSVALKMAGHQMESLIYLGNAIRIRESGIPGKILEALSRREKGILGLVSEQKKRHYVLLNLPYAYSKNVKGYYESIAIMLRNIGNTVTIVELGKTCSFAGEWNQDSKNAILNYTLSTAEKQDRVYDWGINKYQACLVEVDGRKMLMPADLLPHLAKEDEDVVLLTHSVEGVRNAANSSYPLIFLDAISEWDAQKEMISSYGESEWNEIYSCADKVITKRELPFEWSYKKVMPLECKTSIGADEICLREERIIELSHYMRNEEMLCGVLSALKAVEEMESEENYHGPN